MLPWRMLDCLSAFYMRSKASSYCMILLYCGSMHQRTQPWAQGGTAVTLSPPPFIFGLGFSKITSKETQQVLAEPMEPFLLISNGNFHL